MDPNATLKEIDAALQLASMSTSMTGKRRYWSQVAQEHRIALATWIQGGGFAPNWSTFPSAASYCGEKASE